MCGIFGILQHDASTVPDAGRLRQTAFELEQRGPDGLGIFSDLGVGLVHTRLSLVDPNERSRQPFWDRTGRFCLVYNGELYQYEDLKRRLERRGVVWRTTCDTEVLLEALIHFGVEPTLAGLEGMFAFALYDRRDQTLVLARDRLGIKPLHFHQGEKAFLFASTPRAMKRWLTLRPNMLAVSSYLLGFGGPTVGDSFFDQIESLAPGAVLRVRAGELLRRTRFVRVEDTSDNAEAQSLAAEKPARVVDRADELLTRSVRSQLFADAPVGVLCSGGVDSSLLAAIAARHRRDFTIFHADVEGPLSERSAAAALARCLKLDFQAVKVCDSDFIERMPDVIEHYGFPFTFHPESVAMLKLAELVRAARVKAVLCGEGSDECYFGYPWLAPTSRNRLRIPGRIDRWLPRLTAGHAQGLPAALSRDGTGLEKIDGQMELELGQTAFDAWQGTNSQRSAARRRCALTGLLKYVLRTLLHRNDSMGMAAGVEARFPFLSNDLLHFAENLPPAYKMRFSPLSLRSQHPLFCDKWIIRQLAKRYLPKRLSQRPKRPFPTDAYERLTISHKFFENSFLADLLRLNGTRLEQLIEGTDRALRIRLLQLDVWGQICLQETPKCRVLQRLRDHTTLAPAAR
ncbi:MAG TPA: asparagine synthase (glutamine-hydrolyzing) [Pirellulales bacterium]|nr:asparagine synthase (glutamine-hydrolyzing) [Pirellulales bacterium]